MDFITAFNNWGPYFMILAAVMWYVYKKDQMHREEVQQLGKKIDRLTSTIERLLTYVKEKE